MSFKWGLSEGSVCPLRNRNVKSEEIDWALANVKLSYL